MGGLTGGVVMGLMITMLMTPVMIAISHLWGFNSLPAGWFVHLVNSAVIGALFAAVFGNFAKGYASGAGYGLLYGFIWWILGPLFVMPLWLTGQVAFATAFTIPGMMELMAHLVYGLLLGLVFVWYMRRGAVEAPQMQPQQQH